MGVLPRVRKDIWMTVRWLRLAGFSYTQIETILLDELVYVIHMSAEEDTKGE